MNRLKYFWLLLFLITCFGMAVGFALTHRGIITWDSPTHVMQGKWLLSRYFGERWALGDGIVSWYGPFWPLLLTLFSSTVFYFLHDPIWVFHALTFALFPVTLYLAFELLRFTKVHWTTALLACSLLLGCVRFGGHSFVNVKDFPAACVYLLSTLGLWLHLARLRSLSAPERFTTKNLFTGALIAVLPALTRFPLFLHFWVWWGWWFFSERKFILSQSKARGSPSRALLAPAFKPTGAALVWMFALWPTLWNATPRNWIDNIRQFSRFFVQSNVHFFGFSIPADQLPLWYIPAWLPAMVTPPVLLVVLLALAWAIFSPRRFLGSGFRLWLVFFALVPLLFIWLRKSVLFDEERHVLFIYPVFLVWVALVLDELNSRTKLAFAFLCAVSAIGSYAVWGRYSYVYKSPVIGDRSGSRFMGDYWGACMATSVLDLPKFVPERAVISILGPKDVVDAELQRLKTSRFKPVSAFPEYRFMREGTAPGGYLLALNRTGLSEVIFEEMKAGKWQRVHEWLMPPGVEPACFLVKRVSP